MPIRLIISTEPLNHHAGHRSTTIHDPGPRPAAPSDSPDVSCLPHCEPTYAALTGAGSPFQHPKTNVHRFSELRYLPIATSASRLAELCR
ncbi:jg16912 [Pararge aegeria aegeria]|uniref:Jg16912 protein n=1 Tax=Pararge aegeria aegeria TaxID=348720 RepID=A0A8S4SMI4_9NEOP|nr:jg16912 [Pararge aegeria aegeria]